MRKGKHNKPKYKIIEKYAILILIGALFISVAHAKVTDLEMKITGSIDAKAPEGVFISDVTSSNTTNGTINYYTGTMMDSKVILESTSSSITYQVTLHNNTTREQVFIKALTDVTDETLYSNTNIGYTITGLTEGETTIAPGGDVTFTITFAYVKGTDTSNNILESKINFRFREKPILDLSNNGETYTLENIYAGYTPQEYEFTVSNYDKLANNKVPLTYTFETEITEESPLEVEIYNESGEKVTGEISIGGEEKEDHEYTAKIIWDASKANADYEGQEYTCNIKLNAKPTDTDYLEYKIEKEFNVDVTTCKHKTTTNETAWEDGVCTICGKVCEHNNIEIDEKPEKAGTRFTTTGIYSDGTDTATIPAGFTVSGVGPGMCTICGKLFTNIENTISEGLVIYLIDDKTEEEIKAINWMNEEELAYLKKTYDQFVWIPIPKENINDMYMCQSEDGTKSCKITVQEVEIEGEQREVAYCTTHDSTAMAGRLYAKNTGNTYTPTLTTQRYIEGRGLREPDVVTGSSDGTGTEYDASPTYLAQLNAILSTSYSTADDFKTDLQAEYNEIVKSVYQNEGFYIGRYETSGMKDYNTNATIKAVAGSDNTTNSNISNANWYRMYAQQKKYANNKGLTESIGSTMIQGAAYDQVMKFIDPETSFVKTTGRVSHTASEFSSFPYKTGNTNYSSVYTGTVTYNDIAKNIYDLEGNLYTWTTAGSAELRRVIRGGTYATSYSPSNIDATFPLSRTTMHGTICQLYVLDAGSSGDGEGDVELITFEIEGMEYEAEEGMTWAEWIESEYNIGNTFYILDGWVHYDSDFSTAGYTVEGGRAGDLIISSANYRLSPLEDDIPIQ